MTTIYWKSHRVQQFSGHREIERFLLLLSDDAKMAFFPQFGYQTNIKEKKINMILTLLRFSFALLMLQRAEITRTRWSWQRGSSISAHGHANRTCFSFEFVLPNVNKIDLQSILLRGFSWFHRSIMQHCNVRFVLLLYSLCAAIYCISRWQNIK